VGPADAKLTIIEFMDFECPYCARWAARVDSLLAEYPKQVQVVVHHFPLTNRHEYAIQAAVAAECAHQQGRYPVFQRTILTEQTLIGKKPWTAFAAASGVPDANRFEDCVALPPDSFPRIAYGMELGKRVGVRGTPTVWVNGLVQQPTMDEFRKMIAQLKE
jgi:protein-disulfide isomerase